MYSLMQLHMGPARENLAIRRGAHDLALNPMNFKENETATKLRGGYYTHPAIAAFLAKWALARGPKEILEPSCGDGAFLKAIADVKPKQLRTVFACELDPVEAQKASARSRLIHGATLKLHVGDFLKWTLAQVECEPSVDAVVGNPPFIRYQYLEAELQERAERLFKHYRLAFTKHTNAWVSFVLGSLARLRNGGRLAMVVPAELLHVLHAQSLRTHLLETCSKVLVVDPSEILFDDTLQGVVLLLAERRASAGHARGQLAISKIRNREDLGDPEAVFQRATFIPGETLDAKWMPALLTESERSLLAGLVAHSDVHRFGDLARVDVGIITGANKFFLVPDEVVTQHGLERFAYPMFGRSDHVRGVIHDHERQAENRRAGLPANFLWFGPTDRRDLPKRVQAYLSEGEAEGLHKRFKCRSRSPWYNVPSVSAAPIVMLKRAHHYHRMILNTADAFTTDTAYRIYASPEVGHSAAVYSFVNSLTALSAELEGRHYGGGVLELVPSEIERLLIPWNPKAVCDLEALDRDVRSDLAPQAVLERQDTRLLRQLGIDRAAAEELRAAWLRLRDRRHRSEPVEASPDSDESLLPLRKTRPLAPEDAM